MYCNNCGEKIENRGTFCPKCGNKIVNTTVQKDTYTGTSGIQETTWHNPIHNYKKENPQKAVFDMGSFLLLLFLLDLPIVGWILLIIYAIGSSNDNKTNYCRALIVYKLICFVLFLLLKDFIFGIIYDVVIWLMRM